MPGLRHSPPAALPAGGAGDHTGGAVHRLRGPLPGQGGGRGGKAGGYPDGGFQYRGKEFRLRNAARDASRLSIDVLRRSLDTLAQADLRLKSSRTDKRVVLEQTAAR